MKYEAIGSYWYTSSGFGGQIGFVAIKSGPDRDKWKVYCGIGFGVDESTDEQIIAEGGAKVSKEVAVAHFPQFDPDKFVY